MKVVVVGAGLGGLSAACHIVGRGHDVEVLERADVPGGRAGLWETGGYRFDTGPSVLTMTGILRDAFTAAGADMDSLLTLKPVDPMYRACFADGSAIHVRHGREAMVEEIRETAGPKEADGFVRFCDYLTELYTLELPNFIDRNFDNVLDIAKPPWPLFTLVRLGGLRKLSNVVATFFSDLRLQKLFSFQAMYAGLSPFEALALYCVITYMDTVEGVYFPEGGMHAIPRALAAAAEKAGASFRYGTTVDGVVHTTDGRVSGVRLAGGEVVAADAVVLNPDLPVAYRELLPGVPMPRVARKGNYSPSCAVWLAGVKGALPPGAAHHNIHFGDEWEGSFDALLKQGVVMPDPSMLVTSPTASDPSLAPDGRVSLYVLEPTPNLDGNVDWSVERDRLRERLIARVSSFGYPTGDVEVERFVDPTDWERQGMERGTPFALAHNFFQTGPFRPNNRTRHAPGVVFVGSGTVPGVGVPMVLLSGRLAAERVDELA
ncbi:MAG TPA: phytoene desaturase family protein [Acidimicrobiales bacterium]|jgi:phytoene desaturase|nr:phytoene desaturase family protein [Acidimicrobiales bacterium]